MQTGHTQTPKVLNKDLTAVVLVKQAWPRVSQGACWVAGDSHTLRLVSALSCAQAAGENPRQVDPHPRRHGNEIMTTEVQENGTLTLSFQPQGLSVWVVLSNKMRGSDGSICGKNYGGVMAWRVVSW